MYLEQGGLETTHCEGTLQLHFDLLWRNKSKSRVCSSVKAMQASHFYLLMNHKVNSFALKISFIWNFLTVRDSPFSACLSTQRALPGLLFDGLNSPNAMLTSACYLVFHYFMIRLLYFMTASFGIFFFSKKNDKNDPHKSIREVVK